MIKRMTSSSEQTGYRVKMETRQWLIIDGTMDNEVISEAQNGDPSGVVDLGMSIRQAGWDQILGWPQDIHGFETWPASGQRSTIGLSRTQWDLVILTLERRAAVSDRCGDPSDAASSRAIAALVRTQLAQQG
jgi:hypothetical protein